MWPAREDRLARLQPMTQPQTHVYWRQLGSGERTSLGVLAALVKERSRVLDLGIGSGALGQHLSQQLQCQVDGVTVNPQEEQVARSWYQRIDVLDLDQPGWEAGFEPGSYDVIVCADVLEHLAQPDLVLAACRKLLRPEGVLLVSIPNASYAGLVVDLAHGNFEYGNEGLMDRTHLRFFTRRSFQRLLDSQGWRVAQVERIEQPLHETEFSTAFDALPPSVSKYLLAQPDASTYQLVFVAHPSNQAPPGRPLPRVQNVSAATFVAELFVASNSGYTAQRKITRLGTIGLERQTLVFNIPASMGPWPSLRLDPADRPGFFWLHGVRLKNFDAQTVWEWAPTRTGADQLVRADRHQLDIGAPDPAGGPLSLLLRGDDPYVELPIDPSVAAQCSGHACMLEVECGWPMSADYLAAVERVKNLEVSVQRQTERISQLDAALVSERAATRLSERPVKGLATSLRALFSSLAHQPNPDLSASQQFDPIVEIVLPVYNNLALVQRCLASVQASTGSHPFHLTLINDASPEPAVRQWLSEFALLHPHLTVVENARNLGFVETVNLGMRLAGRRDVILLNSDTEVANDWLDRMHAAAYRAGKIGTVTPFSNNATICSYPSFCTDNPLPQGLHTADVDRLCASANRGQSVDIPTAVGFCMYIRRGCLDQVGDFDAASFGQGYGEENDFCLRASTLGWRHLHALDVFVFHQGGASFQETRHALQGLALETIRRLHPGYEDLIRAFVQRDPARPFREAIDCARQFAAATASAPQPQQAS